MVSIPFKFRVGLRVAKQHPCVGKKKGGGFSPGYVLASFPNRTIPSGKAKADHPVWNKSTPTPGKPEKILPIKELAGYRLSQEVRDEQEYLKPRSQVAPSFALYPFNEIKGLSRMRAFDHWWYWILRSGCRQEKEMREVALGEGIMLNLRGESMKIALGEAGDRLTPSRHRMKLEGTCMAQSTPLPTWREFPTNACGSKGFLT